MSSGNFDMVKEAQPNAYILAEDWNNEFLNVIANCGADGIGGASEDSTNWSATLNPIDFGRPGSLREELEELRFQIQAITGNSDDTWYSAPLIDLKTIKSYALVTGGDTHNHKGLTIDPVNGGGALIGSDALEDECIIESKYADLSIPSAAFQSESIDTRCYEDYSITLEKLDPAIGISILKQYYSTIITGPISYSTVAQDPIPLPSQCYSIIDVDFTPKAIGSTLEISIRTSIQNNAGDRAVIILFINDTYYDCISSDNYSIINTKNQCFINHTFLYQTTSLDEINIKVSFTSPSVGWVFVLATDFNLYTQTPYLYVDIKEIKN